MQRNISKMSLNTSHIYKSADVRPHDQFTSQRKCCVEAEEILSSYNNHSCQENNINKQNYAFET